MKITGKKVIDARPEVIWKLILDKDVLARITPGITELEEKAADNFRAISVIKMGPVRGQFEGELFIKDKIEGKSCVVALDQKSKIGNAIAEIGMELIPQEDGKTEVQYSGDAKISGMLARMGQRVIGGVITTLSKQFFSALEEEIKTL